MIDVESLVNIGQGLRADRPSEPKEYERALQVAHFFTWLILENGYMKPRLLPDGRYAALWPLMYTVAIIRGQVGDRDGYDGRWCYRTGPDALAALDAWDGTGEPDGWIRHPKTGRRRAQSLDEWDGDDVQVTHIGQVYVRW